MAITKKQKSELIQQYTKDLSSATTVIIVKQHAIPVNIANQIRMDIKATDAKMNVLRKRLFLKCLKDAGLEEVKVENLEGSVCALYIGSDES